MLRVDAHENRRQTRRTVLRAFAVPTSLLANAANMLARCVILLTVLTVAIAGGDAPSGTLASTLGVGFAEFRVHDPIAHGRMSAVAFYPSDEASGVTTIGPYAIGATRNLALSSGSHELVVISHGTGGSKWDLHDYCEALARAGYVVAALTHPGDNYKESTGLGTDRVLIGREVQLSALIDAVLLSPKFGTHIDRTKIAAAGFSAGGYTSLVLAGARPDFALLTAYCRRHPKDRTFCWNGEVTKIRTTGLKPVRDRRVRAVIALAPVGLYFDRAALSKVSVPVLLFDGQRDDVLLPGENSQRIARLLAIPPARFVIIPKAQHFVFISPCTPRLLALVRSICVDPLGVDRAAVHARIQRDMKRFLAATL